MRVAQTIAGPWPRPTSTTVRMRPASLYIWPCCVKILAMEIQLDTAACTSIGMCESLAPDVFELGDDGFLTVHADVAEETDRAELVAACEACPNSALTVVG